MKRASWQMWANEVLSDENCDEIIRTALQQPAKDATIGFGHVNHEYRSSDVRFLHRNIPNLKELWDLVDYRFEWANRNAFGVDTTFITDMQFTTYREERNGHFKWHQDTFFEADYIYDRKLSMVIQLSDPKDYDGGDLELDVNERPDAALLRTRGSMIVFPGHVYHRVTPVLRGIRHSLVVWKEGPRWR